MKQDQRFRREMRLSGSRAFEEVYAHRRRQSSGPITICVRPNSLAVGRLGLSVKRTVGTAPRRNRIKRLLREAFRLLPPGRASGYDWVVVVRPHEPLALTEYQRLLEKLMRALSS